MGTVPEWGSREALPSAGTVEVREMCQCVSVKISETLLSIHARNPVEAPRYRVADVLPVGALDFVTLL